MDRIETNKALKTIVNFTIDDVGISGLPVKLDLYNETANTWFNGSSWVGSKPSSLTMNDDGAKFNGRYYYSWTPNLDGFYVSYSSCVSAGYEFQSEQDYEAVKLMSNVESISAINNTMNTNIITVSGYVDNLPTIETNILTISGFTDDVPNMNTNVLAISAYVDNLPTIETKINTIKADIEGKVYNTIDAISGDTFNIIGDIADVYSLVNSFANIGSISADVLSGGIYENDVTIKDVDITNNTVYVLYKNATGKLKVISQPFTQGVVIASGVDL